MGDAPRKTERPSCPQVNSCQMYSLFRHSGTLGAWRELYCTSRFDNCARFQASQKGHPVPINLMPNGVLLKTSKA